jgi:hypothetical protein
VLDERASALLVATASAGRCWSLGSAHGLYTWTDRNAMQSYLHGELYAAAVRDNPTFTGVRSQEFGVIDAATRITGAGAAVAAW